MTPARPVLVIGGGIAGLAAALAIAEKHRPVVLLEKRAQLGGRASSFRDRHTGEEIDNCQHIVLGCCTNVLDFFLKIGVAGKMHFSGEFSYISRDSRRFVLSPSRLPAPLHYLPSLLRFGALRPVARLAVIRTLLYMTWMNESDLRAASGITMAEWLVRRQQPAEAIERFWRLILVSALNEELDRVAALPCLQVFLQGFLPHARASLLGVPDDALSTFYAEPARRRIEALGGKVLVQTKIMRLQTLEDGGWSVQATGQREWQGDTVILATPRPAVIEVLENSGFADLVPSGARDTSTSPILGVHLWFDRVVLDRPHAVLLDSAFHWIFSKSVSDVVRQKTGAVQRLQVVSSAARELVMKGQAEIIASAVAALKPALKIPDGTRLVHGVVVKELQATIQATPAYEHVRPSHLSKRAGLFFAGDWTNTGWPSTLEGSVRSGRTAAAAALGGTTDLTPDLPRAPLARLALWRTPKKWPDVRGSEPG